MKLLQFILRQARTVAIAAVIASILSGVMSAFIIMFAKDAVAQPDAGSGPAIAFFVLGAVAVLSRIGSESLLMHLLQESLYHMRRQLVASVLRTPLRELEQMGTAPISAALTSDVNTVSQAIVGMPLFLLNTTITLACTVFMWTISPLAAGIGCLLIPIGILAHKAIAGGTLTRFRRSREKEDDLFHRFGELTGGIKELKLSHPRQQQFMNESLEEAAQAYKKYKIMGLYYFLTTISLMKYLFYAYLGLVLFILPANGFMNTELVVPAVFIILYGIGPLSSVLHWLPNWSQARVALDKIEQLGLTLQATEEILEPPTHLPTSVESIETRGLTYSHAPEKDGKGFNLGPIDTKLEGGKIHYIVGGNGSGKTTFAKLIMGLYDSAGGQIHINGRPTEARERRALFSVVFADLTLFAELPPDSDQLKAQSLLQELGLAHRVSVENGRFTNVDRLSQGQRKRLALVTALLEDRPIYLFDEWAADQDPEFRQRFYHHILPDLKKRGKLVIAISHDDRWFHLADHLITLDYGRLRKPELTAATTA